MSSPLRAAGAVLATTVAVSVPVFLVGGLAVPINSEFPLSPAQVGVAVAAWFGTSALASVPAGALVERYGPAWTGRCGVGLVAVCMLSIAVGARSAGGLTVLLAAGAGGNALGQLAGNAQLARQVPARRHGVSFGLKQAAVPASTLLAGGAVPVVAGTVGWRWAFVLASLLCAAVMALPAGKPVPGTGPAGKPAPGSRPVGSDAPAPAEAPLAGETAAVVSAAGDDPPVRTPFIRTRGPLLVLGAAALLGAAGANALGAFLVSSAVAAGTAPGRAGLGLALGSAVCVAVRVLGGWLADRRPGRQGTVITGMLAGGALGLLLLAVPGDAAWLAGSLAAFGLGWAWPGLLNFAVARRYPRTPAAATSVTLTGAQAGACLGPLGLGMVASAAGYPAMWITAATVMAAAAGLMLSIRASV